MCPPLAWASAPMLAVLALIGATLSRVAGVADKKAALRRTPRPTAAAAATTPRTVELGGVPHTAQHDVLRPAHGARC